MKDLKSRRPTRGTSWRDRTLPAKFADDFVSPPKSTRTNLGVRLTEEFEGEAPEPEAQGRRDLRTPELMSRHPDLGILRGLGILLIEEDLEEDLGRISLSPDFLRRKKA